MNINKTGYAIGYCDHHGKLMYNTRRRAKTVAKKHSQHKGVYECEITPGMYHIGKIPREVLHGEMTRDEFFGRFSRVGMVP